MEEPSLANENEGNTKSSEDKMPPYDPTDPFAVITRYNELIRSIAKNSNRDD